MTVATAAFAAVSCSGGGSTPGGTANEPTPGATQATPADTATPVAAGVGTTVVAGVAAPPAATALVDATARSIAVARVDEVEPTGPQVFTYDIAGRQLALVGTSETLDARCGVADVTVPSGQDLVLTMHIAHSPAQGVNPARDARLLTAWDAATGAQVWMATLFTTTESSSGDSLPSCAGSGNAVRNALSTTTDGAWGVFGYVERGSEVGCTGTCADSQGPWIVNLTTGDVRVDRDAIVAAGRYVLDAHINSTFPTLTAGPLKVIDPVNRRVVGAPKDPLLSEVPNAMTYSAAFIDRAYGAAHSDYHVFVVSSDGTRLYAASEDARKLVTYPLPSMVGGKSVPFPAGVAAWQYTYQTDTFFDAETSTVVVDSGQGQVTGFPRAGGPPWSVNADDACGVAHGKVVVMANRQLATLDALTGKQLAFDPAVGSCPLVFPTGLAFDGSDIVQLL
ncbi:MAG: hypothetical protein QOJ92_1886 [Frankiales bacterium]|nr:hypothetical protein [Frankiales bacterium]